MMNYEASSLQKNAYIRIMRTMCSIVKDWICIHIYVYIICIYIYMYQYTYDIWICLDDENNDVNIFKLWE